MDHQSTLKKLDAISPTFCAAKWFTSHLHLESGTVHSCCLSPQTKIGAEQIKENPHSLFNPPEILRQRQALLDGHQDKSCEHCWVSERAGLPSERTTKSGLPWSVSEIPRGKKNLTLEATPSFLEISYSNKCNLRCSYCTPSASSAWESELSSGRHFPKVKSVKTHSESENPYNRSFQKLLPQILPALKRLKITGGEPLLHESTQNILELASQSSGLKLSLHSNMCVTKERMNQFINSVQRLTQEGSKNSFCLFASIDTWGEQAEFARYGLDIRKFEENVRLFLQECPNAFLSFSVTLQILSLPQFDIFLKKVRELKDEFDRPKLKRVFFSINRLDTPAYQSLITLPREYASLLDQHYLTYKKLFNREEMGFEASNAERFEQMIQWMKENCDHEEVHKRRKEFYEFFTRYSQMTKKNFSEVFPELNEFWQICKRAKGL